MTILTLANAHLAYGHYPLLADAQFSLLAGERVGLIGRNGTGKSSLLKVISGLSQLDSGRFTQQNGLRVEFVSQEPILDPDTNLFDTVSAAFAAEFAVMASYDECLAKLSSGELNAEQEADTLHHMAEFQAQLDSSNVWQIRNRVDEALKRFDLNPTDLVSALSGGQKKRVALARALVTQPDVLLLDEPTNHLDITSILWLEQTLVELPITLLFVTHDRQFLDAVATRIIELDRGILNSYPGNYTAYSQLKADQLAIEATFNARFDKVLAQEEIWIRKGVEARRTRNEGRVRRLQALRRERSERLNKTGSVQMQASKADLSGKLVAELTHVSHAYPGKTGLITDLSSLIMRGDKVGLIGDNGVGKTTLLRLILGQLQPSAGNVRLGTNLSLGYFDQMRAALDETATVVETISPGSEWIEINGQRKHVMSYLADFLFAPERARSPVQSLSGGERNRLLLARLFASPSNLLVLDEPTNDLDMDTLDLLEELLIDYSGTVLLVSHDRRFLDNVVTQSIAHVSGDQWMNIIGGYSVWQEQRPQVLAAYLKKQSAQKAAAQENAKAIAAPSPANINDATAPLAPKSKAAKLSYKQQRQLAELPKTIEALEQEQASITKALADGSIYANDPGKGMKMSERFAQIESELLEALEAWEQLSQTTS